MRRLSERYEVRSKATRILWITCVQYAGNGLFVAVAIRYSYRDRSSVLSCSDPKEAPALKTLSVVLNNRSSSQEAVADFQQVQSRIIDLTRAAINDDVAPEERLLA